MATKPNAKDCIIKEAIIEDLVTGITLQFEARDSGEFALYLYGNFEFGNRTLNFDKNGEMVGAGTHLRDCPRPTWISEAKAE